MICSEESSIQINQKIGLLGKSKRQINLAFQITTLDIHWIECFGFDLPRINEASRSTFVAVLELQSLPVRLQVTASLLRPSISRASLLVCTYTLTVPTGLCMKYTFLGVLFVFFTFRSHNARYEKQTNDEKYGSHCWQYLETNQMDLEWRKRWPFFIPKISKLYI